MIVSDQNRVLLRMRDVAIALACANNYDRPLGKLQLQKFVYLLDALSVLFLLLPTKNGFHTYKRGPWDVSIQNAVDTLVFRGFVEIVSARELESGEVAVQYQMTNEGNDFSLALKRTHAFDNRFRAGEAIARKVNSLGWHRLKALVYAEPTFVATRVEGFGRDLSPSEAFDSSTRALIEVIRECLEVGWSNFKVDEDIIVDVFFRFLDTYGRHDRKMPQEGLLWT